MLISLQYVRGLAALLVVYFHAVLQVRTAWNPPEPLFPLFGQSGVDLFFVLSGFVMWTSTADKCVSPVEFYRRRMVRIVPLYWSVTLAAIAIAILAPQLLRSTKFELGHSIASLLFLPWPNPAFEPGNSEWLAPVVIPGWTLNYEMLFYALFGVALLARRGQRFWFVAALICASLLMGLLLGQFVAPLRFYTNSMLFEFLAGVAIGAFAQSKLPRRDWMFWLALLGLLPLLWLDWLGIRWDRAIELGAPAAAIVLLMVLAERSGPVPQSKWWHDTGDASYSIYLTHVFVITALRVVVKASGLPMSIVGEILFVIAAIIVSAVVGRLVYFRYERPVTRLAARHFLAAKRPARIASDVA